MERIILEWPKQWAAMVDTTFRLVPNSLFSPGLSPGAPDVYGPLAQVWTANVPIGPKDRRTWQAMTAFFSRLAGISGQMRMHDPKRPRPWRDMGKLAGGPWSDGTLFTDGTGWSTTTQLPPYAVLDQAAIAGDDSIVIKALPASLAPCFVAGDLMEIRPDGIPSEFGHLYEAAFDAPTDADGKTRVYVSPGLREAVAAGDMVLLDRPTSVFRAVDDNQGILSHMGGGFAQTGFSLIEVLPS